MKIDTLNAIIRAFQTASTDQTRFNIQHVKMTASEDKIILESSDGHMMTTQVVDDAELSKDLGYIYAVSPDLLPILEQLAKGYKTIKMIPHSLDGSILTLKGFGISVQIKTSNHAGVTFPDYKLMNPTPTEQFTEIGLNAEYLLAILKTLRTSNKTTGVTLKIRDKLSPIELSCISDNEVSALLMPLRR